MQIFQQYRGPYFALNWTTSELCFRDFSLFPSHAHQMSHTSGYYEFLDHHTMRSSQLRLSQTTKSPCNGIFHWHCSCCHLSPLPLLFEMYMSVCGTSCSFIHLTLTALGCGGGESAGDMALCCSVTSQAVSCRLDVKDWTSDLTETCNTIQWGR